MGQILPVVLFVAIVAVVVVVAVAGVVGPVVVVPSRFSLFLFLSLFSASLLQTTKDTRKETSTIRFTITLLNPKKEKEKKIRDFVDKITCFLVQCYSRSLRRFLALDCCLEVCEIACIFSLVA